MVKHMLALFEEAVLVYKSILDEHCDYVPALKGMYSNKEKTRVVEENHRR